MGYCEIHLYFCCAAKMFQQLKLPLQQCHAWSTVLMARVLTTYSKVSLGGINALITQLLKEFLLRSGGRNHEDTAWQAFEERTKAKFENTRFHHGHLWVSWVQS